MSRLRVQTRKVDTDRTARLLVAWLSGDKVALDVVLDEAMRDPAGTPGLLFSLTDLCARFADDHASRDGTDAVSGLRTFLLERQMGEGA